MKTEIDFNKYDKGFVYTWYNNFSIKTEVLGEEIYISANKQGLLSLAANLIALAQDDVPDGVHMELDEYNSLEENSKSLIIEKKSL